MRTHSRGGEPGPRAVTARESFGLALPGPEGEPVTGTEGSGLTGKWVTLYGPSNDAVNTHVALGRKRFPTRALGCPTPTGRGRTGTDPGTWAGTSRNGPTGAPWGRAVPWPTMPGSWVSTWASMAAPASGAHAAGCAPAAEGRTTELRPDTRKCPQDPRAAVASSGPSESTGHTGQRARRSTTAHFSASRDATGARRRPPRLERDLRRASPAQLVSE